MRLINLSEASYIGFHALSVLVLSNCKMSIKELAQKTESSEFHLRKIKQRLAKDGIVKSTRGPEGGFILAREPEKISLLEVYESIEGKIDSNPCVYGKQNCTFDMCLFKEVLGELNDRFYKFLQQTNMKAFTKERGVKGEKKDHQD